MRDDGRLDGGTALIYPRLGGSDFGIFRLGGAGMGNYFFAYFHAVVLADAAGARLIAPTWWSIRIGPLLRRDTNLRRYGTMFRPHCDEIAGIRKIVRLATGWSRHTRAQFRPGHPVRAVSDGLTIVDMPTFSFDWLQSHRVMIRQRLIDILITPPSRPLTWGNGAYVAVHIRLGDTVAAPPSELASGKAWHGVRIPMTWYQAVIRRVRHVWPELPVYVFSDGLERELRDVLAIDGVRFRHEPSDVADLLALAQARLLIGSQSTFSGWAAFLGDMPSIWLKTARSTEQPSGAGTPILYVADDVETIRRELVAAA